jgi:hypothetical protein
LYYQEAIKDNQEWRYPTGETDWKVRFSPDRPGSWQFKLTVRDASGYSESAPRSFTVIDSSDHGFVRVSPTDRRYFEFDDGTYFPGLGLETGSYFGDPNLTNESYYQAYQQNKIQLGRIWISGLWGNAWPEWIGGRNIYDGYLPRTGYLPFRDANTNRVTATMIVDYEPEGDSGWFDACRFQFMHDWEAVKPNTNYKMSIRYWGVGITGPRDSRSSKFGLVGKISGGWYANCYEAGTASVVTAYGGNTTDWQTIEGTWFSGSNNFLPRVYIGLENVLQGDAFVDMISLREDLGNGQFGPEIIAENSMQYELYIPELSAFKVDKLIEMAERYDHFFKIVIADKNDHMFLKLNDDGTFVIDAQEDNMDGFYGLGRTMNKTKWLHQAYWRYLQARWGYSTHIHSWELTNEGDPGQVRHYQITDELGKFMHCRAFGVAVGEGDGQECTLDHPNAHMVTTSFWHSFMGQQFWGNAKYPNVDYADVHAYISTGWRNDPTYERDFAAFHLDYSEDVRSNLDWYSAESGVPTKPIVRGETGFDFLNQQEEQPDLQRDTQGVGLHNFIWSGMDAGALMELYWWGMYRDSQPGLDGVKGLYEHYRLFYDFIWDIPLNNGHYRDAQPQASNADLRAVGQTDTVNSRSHLWIQNKRHTWRNVIDGVAIPPVSGTVTLPGFLPNESYRVDWWDPYQLDPAKRVVRQENLQARADGSLTLTVSNLATDIAARILPVGGVPTGSFTDVPVTHAYFREIEALYRAGYTAGCATNPLRYCPDSTMNRGESAVFVERGIHAATYDPPIPISQVFADLPLDSWAAKWVNGLWQDQYTAGCGTNPLVYCPWQGHTRAEGCVFYLRMMNGATYDPPQPSQPVFTDVPLDAWYAKWAHAAYQAGLITACGTSPALRFCPQDPLTRGLAAYMMVRAKSLPLP